MVKSVFPTKDTTPIDFRRCIPSIIWLEKLHTPGMTMDDTLDELSYVMNTSKKILLSNYIRESAAERANNVFRLINGSILQSPQSKRTETRILETAASKKVEVEEEDEEDEEDNDFTDDEEDDFIDDEDLDLELAMDEVEEQDETLPCTHTTTTTTTTPPGTPGTPTTHTTRTPRTTRTPTSPTTPRTRTPTTPGTRTPTTPGTPTSPTSPTSPTTPTTPTTPTKQRRNKRPRTDLDSDIEEMVEVETTMYLEVNSAQVNQEEITMETVSSVLDKQERENRIYYCLEMKNSKSIWYQDVDLYDIWDLVDKFETDNSTIVNQRLDGLSTQYLVKRIDGSTRWTNEEDLMDLWDKVELFNAAADPND